MLGAPVLGRFQRGRENEKEQHDLAAKFRVAHREDSGLLHVGARLRQLDAAFAASNQLQTTRCRVWFADSAYHRLQTAVEECGRLGIRIDELEAELGASQPRTHTEAVYRHLRLATSGSPAGPRSRPGKP